MSRLWTGDGDNPFADRTFLIAGQPVWVEPLVKTVLEVGGHPISVNKVEEIFSFLKFEQPEFFILSEGFDQDNSPPNVLLEYIQNMPTSQRREIFVIWVGANIKTGDMLSAFSHSVNLVLQQEKLSELTKEIKKSWSQWKDLYQVFLQTRLQLTGC
jgi:hypothetical protein